MQLFTNSLLIGLGTVLGNQISQRLAYHRSPHPMPHQFADMLDHPWRLRYREPVDTVGLFGIVAGMEVLDLGCGTGTFTVEMARMAGPEGTVHAVDLQRSLLARAKTRMAVANVAATVHFHHCGAYQLPLETSSIDLAVLLATLSQIPEKERALAELRRVLKPGGRLAVSDELPNPAYVPPPVSRQWLEQNGFLFGGQSGSYFCYTQLFLNDKDESIIEGEATVVTATNR
ncbi:MAG: methyltransferase domain-containing protein [Thermomicrobiales bacterium]|nr:methyltransferase domain-containing protein [Thermomicrobiales bacterium]